MPLDRRDAPGTDTNATSAKAKREAPPYDEIALVLQGGGALGSYQAGVYEGLAEAGLEPTWIAGISIGALNTAILAGNPPKDRVAALHAFWDTITKPEDFVGGGGAWALSALGLDAAARGWTSGWSAFRAVMEGQQGFFTPRPRTPLSELDHKTPDEVSHYRTEPLIETLRRYADFDRINNGDMRVSVGAVNVRSGNFAYFDNRQMRLGPEHFAASGALPPGFPAVEIDGEYYWDGGIVSNTPLVELLGKEPDKDLLIFQVDLWSSKGRLPANFADVEERIKDIQYSSRTRMVTDMVAHRRRQSKIVKDFLDTLPEEIRRNNPAYDQAAAIAATAKVNLFHLIYQNKFFEKGYKDIEFSAATMLEHWGSGLRDIRRSLAQPGWLDPPNHDLGFVTHDIHRLRED
ncbi:MAG: patatin-like phospholipase family protein [Azospirillaceae bacterium]|nr:patatin-like phospholipase family protein [Azospirillaceae bacterium]